jgi:3-dehydroquinate dehydratase-1
MTFICASLLEESVDDFIETVKKTEAELIEIRADGLRECTPDNVHRLLSEIKKITTAKIILTIRKKDEGGNFKGTEEDRKRTILGNLHLADIVDIELKSDFREEVVDIARSNKIEVIISAHNFEKTPSIKEMKNIITDEMEAGADHAKVAFKANSPHDVLELLKLTEEMSRVGRVIAISMGEAGKISRVVAPFFGSSITYASAGGKTAPGQLSIEETRNVIDILGDKK